MRSAKHIRGGSKNMLHSSEKARRVNSLEDYAVSGITTYTGPQ